MHTDGGKEKQFFRPDDLRNQKTTKKKMTTSSLQCIHFPLSPYLEQLDVEVKVKKSFLQSIGNDNKGAMTQGLHNGLEFTDRQIGRVF